MKMYDATLTSNPTAMMWMFFLKLSDILKRFLFCKREVYWSGYVSKAANMLPYLATAGHHKYEQESLRLFIKEMKELPVKVPSVHFEMVTGIFVARKNDGYCNSVATDMILDQLYTAVVVMGL